LFLDVYSKMTESEVKVKKNQYELLEKGLIDFECGLCEEEISSTDVATCLRCEKQWCIECAVKWYQKSDLKTCPYCRNEDVDYPFDVIEAEEEVEESDEDRNYMQKNICVLMSYTFFIVSLLLYFYSDDSFDIDISLYYFLDIVGFLYVVTFLSFIFKAFCSRCRCI